MIDKGPGFGINAGREVEKWRVHFPRSCNVIILNQALVRGQLEVAVDKDQRKIFSHVMG